ncbi:MAG: ABC transporter permease subunit [Bacteroidetes bacterium]|nr:ABC transporter permease subunit [Bacteroidota bacterium]
MNNNLYKKDFRKDLKVLFFITLAMLGFLAITLSMYSAMKDSMSAVTDLYSTMPAAFQDALNFHEGQWNSVLGFYATYFVYYVPMMTGAYAIYLGSSILSREEQQGTAEFLLTRPITRNQIISSKLAVLLTNITVVNLALWINGVLWTGIIEDFPTTFLPLSIVHSYGLFICYFFGVMGFFITVLMKRAKAIIGPAIGLVMFMYMFDMVLRISDKVQFLLYFTPYKYMNIDLLNTNYHMEWWRLLVLAVATALMISLSYLIYRKKDILL